MENNNSVNSVNQCIDPPEVVQQLKQSDNEVHIRQYSDLEKCKKEIEEYQQNSKQYRIEVNFCSSSMDSIDNKMDVLQMINTLNANTNVGKVWIGLSDIILMINRFTNVYAIYVWDYNESVDDQMHNMIKQYVQQQPIVRFTLLLFRSLRSNNDGYELIKQYNQLIKQKQQLEYLVYDHKRIVGCRHGNTKHQIEELMDRVEK